MRTGYLKAILLGLVFGFSSTAQAYDLPAECGPGTYTRKVTVATATELTDALSNAQAGDYIHMQPGIYNGNFKAWAKATSTERITLCGASAVVLDGGDFNSGYGFHLKGAYWRLSGFTVRNALIGVMLDYAKDNVLQKLNVYRTGQEGIHLRKWSQRNIVKDSKVHDTGLKTAIYGEGIYIGSSVTNWETYTDGKPDSCDDNRVLNNTIYNTTSESIDIKEGTKNGVVKGNYFDGSKITGADSWVDVKGSNYTISENHGVNSPNDGFQTHVITDPLIGADTYGHNNSFTKNTADVNADGLGFWIDSDSTGTQLACDNVVLGAAEGFANHSCQ